jgi:hypothetical protein
MALESTGSDARRYHRALQAGLICASTYAALKSTAHVGPTYGLSTQHMEGLVQEKAQIRARKAELLYFEALRRDSARDEGGKSERCGVWPYGRVVAPAPRRTAATTRLRLAAVRSSRCVLLAGAKGACIYIRSRASAVRGPCCSLLALARACMSSVLNTNMTC